MRKLCRGFWYAMKHDQEFDYNKLLAAKRRLARGVRNEDDAVIGEAQVGP